MVLLFVPLVAWAKHGTGITTGDYWDCIKRPLIAGALAGAAGWFIHLSFRSVLAPIPLLALELILFSGGYVALLLFGMGQKDFYMDLVRQILRQGEGSTVTV